MKKTIYLLMLISLFCIQEVTLKANPNNSFDTSNSTLVSLKSNGYIYQNGTKINMGIIEDDGLKFWNDKEMKTKVFFFLSKKVNYLLL